MFEYSFGSLGPALEEEDIGNFRTHFAIFRYLIGPLVANLLHILVEQVLSFEISTQTSILDKY